MYIVFPIVTAQQATSDDWRFTTLDYGCEVAVVSGQTLT